MRFEAASAAALPAGVWRWPHVDAAKEWADRMSGRIVIETTFLDKVEHLRAVVGRPLIINSGYRTPEHNAAVSATGENGPHTTGRAVDIRVYGAHALDVIRAAFAVGFTGIGLSQKGSVSSRFVHLDDLTEGDGYPRPNLWTY